MASEPRTARMRLIRRRCRSVETAASSARPIASPIRSTRSRMFELIVYGGFSVMLLVGTSRTGSPHPPRAPVDPTLQIGPTGRDRYRERRILIVRPNPVRPGGTETFSGLDVPRPNRAERCVVTGELCKHLLHSSTDRANRRCGSHGDCAATCCTIIGPAIRRRRANSNCATACCTIWRPAAVPARPVIESAAVAGLVDLNGLGVALAPYPTIDGFTPVHCVVAPLESSSSLRSAPKRSMRVLFRVRTAPGPVSSEPRPAVGPHRSLVSVAASGP